MARMIINKSGSFINFLSPEKANIRSLKVHFSPKQEGSGDPSPENVRPIGGRDSVTVSCCGKNLFPLTKNSPIYSVGTGYDKTLKRNIEIGAVYQNVSANNYWLGKYSNNYVDVVGNGTITFVSDNNAYSGGIGVILKP